MPRAVAIAVGVLLLAGPAVASPPAAALDDALDWLAERMAADSSFPSSGLAPYLVEAAAAARLDPASWPTAPGVLDRLAFPPPGGPLLPLLRPAHAWAVAGRDLGDVDGRDVRAEILAAFDGAQFGDPTLLNDDAFAILALRADNLPVSDARLQAAAGFLAAHQEGGWSWSTSGTAETDMTGMVLVALDAVGVVPDRDAARAFLDSARTLDGGWGLSAGADAGNCDSSVWALRGLDALGTAAPSGAWSFLLGLQGAEGGFSYRPGTPPDALCTAEAATLRGFVATGQVPFTATPAGRPAPGPGIPLALAALVLRAAFQRIRRP